jgi:hypothetical protein
MRHLVCWFNRHAWVVPCACLTLVLGYIAQIGVKSRWTFDGLASDAFWKLIFFVIGILIWVPIAWLATRQRGVHESRLTVLLELYLVTSVAMAVPALFNASADLLTGSPIFLPPFDRWVGTAAKLFQLIAFFSILGVARTTSPSPRVVREGGFA